MQDEKRISNIDGLGFVVSSISESRWGARIARWSE
jgi:hypothetical protein